MTLRRHLGVAALSGVAILNGCKVGPNYKVPAMPAPPAYSDNGHNGNWTTATPADANNRGDWWAIYQMPELNDLEQRCATANQSIVAAYHNYEAAHALVMENKADLYPTIGLGTSASRARLSGNRSLNPSGLATSAWDFVIPLQISWEPDLWGSIRRQIESASANAQATAADLANTQLSLQGLLAVTYLQIRGIDLQVQLLRNTIDAYNQTLHLTQVLLKGGLATQLDVEQAQAQVDQTQAQLIDLGVQRDQYVHAIAVLVGTSATGFHIAEQPLTGDPPAIPTGIPSELLQRRPDVAGLERRVAAANALIGVAQAAYYPNITLGAEGGLESSQISTLFNTSSSQWNAGPSATEILYDAGRRKAQVQLAVAQREQAAALYRNQVLSAFRDVEDQLSALRILEQEAGVEAQAVEAARRSTNLSLLRYRRGIAAYLEVLTNQTIQLQDERTAASIVARRMVASAQLQMALGGGWNTNQLPPN